MVAFIRCPQRLLCRCTCTSNHLNIAKNETIKFNDIVAGVGIDVRFL